MPTENAVWKDTNLRLSKYLKNIIEHDHRGVKCLASFWKKYPDAGPTIGQNSDSFGNFAAAVLCAKLVNASASNVRTALR